MQRSRPASRVRSARPQSSSSTRASTPTQASLRAYRSRATRSSTTQPSTLRSTPEHAHRASHHVSAGRSHARAPGAPGRICRAEGGCSVPLRSRACIVWMELLRRSHYHDVNSVHGVPSFLPGLLKRLRRRGFWPLRKLRGRVFPTLHILISDEQSSRCC